MMKGSYLVLSAPLWPVFVLFVFYILVGLG